MWKSEDGGREAGFRGRDATLKRVGNLSQLAGARLVTFESGKGRGTRAVEVRNAAGLSFTVLADQCLDLLDLSWKGTNIGFISKNGLVGNQFFNAHGREFLHYWPAGMLYTCGLANTGPSCVDDGLERTEHGRIGMTPAENLNVKTSWEGEDYSIAVEGEMCESMVCGPRLSLRRSIGTGLFAKELQIRDRLSNEEPEAEEFMLLYHFNFGYPLLDAGARFVVPEGSVSPRTPEAAVGLDGRLSFAEPIDGAGEQCYFYDCRADEDGFCSVALVNDRLGIGAYICYRKSLLPILTQWKNPRSHDYTMGIEPGNSYLMGRKLERENGTLLKIPGYGSIDYDLRLGILDGPEEIAGFEDYLRKLPKPD
jgi:hypothetical protein